jgi:KDO2-lipid IV(A) lauroyltransferase
MSAEKGDLGTSSGRMKYHAARRAASNEAGLSRALEMVRVAAPSWRDLAAGGETRRKWLVYWLWDIPLDGLQWLLFHVFSVLPITFVSGFGRVFARHVAPRFFPDAMARTLANLRWLEPTWSDAQVRDVAVRHFESIGRLKAEFSVLHRLMRSGRVSIENGELARKTMEAEPVVLVGMHLGNWEILGPVLAEFGIPVFDIFEPQPSRMQTRLALKVRARTGPAGSVAFARNANAPRAAIKWLKNRGTLIIFCDEAVNGISAAPFFGRPPHIDSNYAFAARLARLSDATLLPFYVLRYPGCRFTLRFGSPLRLASTSKSDGRLLDEVALLNEAVEPVVKAHLDQWFWLNWGFAGVRYSP